MARLTRLPKVVVEALEDLKGLEIKVLEVRKMTAVTDWMVICTGTSNRHVKSLADNVILKAKQEGVPPRGVQGMEQGEWVLVDLIEVVVHVMLVGARAHYQLEKLWDLRPDDVPSMAVKTKSKPKAKTKRAVKAPKRKPAAKKKARRK